MEKESLSKFERAAKKVKEIKDFYNHIAWFLGVNIVLFCVRFGVFKISFLDFKSMEKNFAYWIDTNMTVMPLLWLFGLVCHGLYVYKYKFQFFENWEQKQIKKYMDDENDSKYI